MTRLSWINGLIGGLLISSCCIIQLFLNLFGIGCAGLNTLLLPYRPLFISLTIISLTYSFYRYRPSKWHFTTIVIFTLLLSFSPELLRIYNNQFSSNDLIDNQVVITHWIITGMHCEACRSAVIQSLRKLTGVLSVNVDLETGRAELTTHNTINIDTVIQAVQSAGFQAKKLVEKD
jgi:copper chaperone CopZ